MPEAHRPVDMVSPRDDEDPEGELYEAFLQAVLRGEAVDPDRFLAERGGSLAAPSAELRERLVSILDLAQGDPSPGGTTKVQAESGLAIERLGEFRLLRVIGTGGMGRVYLAEQESLGRLVAVKVMRTELVDSPTAHARFEREARALARLEHPGIVGVLGFGEDEGVRYLAMELVPGQSLAELLRDTASKGETLPPASAARWALEVARALECAHGAGLLHRDVKPSNVRIHEDGRAVLCDFGLARDAAGEDVTLTGEFAGSPGYASPEQLDGTGELDERTDVYSLGTTLYHALTGRPPFRSESVRALLNEVLSDDPVPTRTFNRAIPRDLDVVCGRAMEKSRERRYASAAALAADLEAVLELRPIRARPPGLVERALKWARRNRAAAAGILSAAAAAVIGAFLLVYQAHRTHQDRLSDAREVLDEARAAVERYGALRSEIEREEKELLEVEYFLDHRHLSDAELDRIAEIEVEVAESRLERQRAFYEVVDKVARAKSIDPTLAEEANRLVAEVYLEKVKEAVSVGDRVEQRLQTEALAKWDPDGRLQAEAFPFIDVTFSSETPGTRAWLFQLAPFERAEGRSEPRMVAIPHGDPSPAVDPDSWALRKVGEGGPLEHGDLVVEIAGAPVRGSVFALTDGADGVRRFDRLVEVDGASVRDDWELERARDARPAGDDGRSFVFERGTERVEVTAPDFAALGVELGTARELARRGDVPALRHVEGRLEPLVLPPGMQWRVTARPFLRSPACEIDLSGEISATIEPGPWAVVVREPGLAERIRVIRTGTKPSAYAYDLTLPAARRIDPPPGFVQVPVEPGYWDRGELWILEREVTAAEYLEFLDDPETLAQVEASILEGDPQLFPRSVQGPGARPFWYREVSGRFRIPEEGIWSGDVPVIGVSFDDAVAYAEWRTRRLDDEGIGGRLRLPTYYEHQMAGGGFGHHGYYAYGSRFHQRYANTCFSRPTANPEPVMSYPTDESIFGVYDLSGNAMEWVDSWFDENRGLRHAAGGSWGQTDPEVLKIAGGLGYEPSFVSGETGFRLVWEPPEDDE